MPCYYDGSFEFMNSLFYKWVFFLFVFLVDFSRKRQQKKVSVARTKGTSGKGFVPSKKNTRMKKGDTLTSVVSEVSGGDKKQTVEVNVDDTDKEGELEFSQEEKFEAVDRIDEIVRDVGELSLLDETAGVR